MQFRHQSLLSLILKILLETLRRRSIKIMSKEKRIERRKVFSKCKKKNEGSKRKKRKWKR